MSYKSTDRCPNCDAFMEGDYCYECGYTTSSYNYLADRVFLEKVHQEISDRRKAEQAIKKMYHCLKIECNKVYLPPIYADADRESIKRNIKKVNQRYNTKFDFWIDNIKGW